MDDEKLFFEIVATTITKHPDWQTGLIMSMQLGVSIALEKHIKEKVDLAYALAAMFPYITNVGAKTMQPGLAALADFFKGAPIESDIRHLMEVKGE